MEELLDLKDRMERERPTPWEELPDLALYMDQIIAYMPRQLIRFDDREALTSAGLVLSGLSPDGRLVETVELTDQPFFVGVQYHPEFKSRPNHAHPLFKGFVQAALERENT